MSVGSSRDAERDPSLARRVASMVCEAYGYQRVDEHEVCHRLAMGDAGELANRVLHLAWRKGADGSNVLTGCCSSTVQPPWTERGCGHWGLMVVGREFQGSGVGSLLVAAAEERLARKNCSQVQIEYEFTCGDPASERLAAWYEGKCGFSSHMPLPTRPGRRQFRSCRKRLERLPARPEELQDGCACLQEKQPASTTCPATSDLGRPIVCPTIQKVLRYLASHLVPSICNPRFSGTRGASRESASHGST